MITDADKTLWLRQLSDDEAVIRYRAIQSLASAKATEAAKPMLVLLQTHPDMLTRWEIIKTLPSILTDDDIKWVIAVQRDYKNMDWKNRVWLQLGLIGVDTPYTHEHCRYTHWSVERILNLRDEYSEDIVAELIELAVFPQARSRIAHVLGDWEGDEAFPYLYQLSQYGGDFDVWQTVMLTLLSPGEADDDKVNHALRRKAIDYYEPILYAKTASIADIAMAIGVLGGLDAEDNYYSGNPPKYAARITEFLSHDYLRFYAAYTFEGLRYSDVVQALIDALHIENILAQDEHTQYTPGWVIGAMRTQQDPAVVPKIREMLGTIRQWSAAGKLPPHSLAAANSLINSAVDALAQLTTFDTLDGERLLAMLYDIDIDTMAAASLIEAIGKAKYKPALDRLIQMTSPEFRQFFDRRVYGELLQNIAYTLGEIGDRKAHETLLYLLASNNDAVQVQAAHALLKLGDRCGLDALLRIVQDEQIAGRTREAAANALADFNDSRVVPALVQALQTKYPMTKAGDILIQRQAVEAVELLELLLTDKNERIQQEVRRVLKGLGMKFEENS